METYLMMLYVTLDQESALKQLFDDNGWPFCKLDLSVTTDKLGPTRKFKVKRPASPVILGKRKATSSARLVPAVKLVKIIAGKCGKPKEVNNLQIVSQESQTSSVNAEDEIKIKKSTNSDICDDDDDFDNKEEISDVTTEMKNRKDGESFDVADHDEEAVSQDVKDIGNNDFDDDINNDLDDVGDEENDDTDDSFEGMNDEVTEEKLDGTNVSVKIEAPGPNTTEQSSMENFPSQTTDQQASEIMHQEQETLQTETGKRVLYTCKTCGLQYHNKHTWTQHKKEIHSWPHFCRSCSVAFNTVEKLKQHNLEKHSHMYTCRTCDKEFTWKNALSVHIKTIHEGGERFPCTWQDCDKSFYRQDKLRDHMNKHTGLRLYSCKKCEKTYFSKTSLNQHWKVCKTDGLSCSICGQVLSSQGCLKDHIQGVHIKTPLICACGQVFTLRNMLSTHKKNCSVLQGSKKSLDKAEGKETS